MKNTAFFSSCILGTALIIGSVVTTPTFAGERRDTSTGERGWLSLSQVHARLEAAGYRNIEKIEREHGGYEARATDANGSRVKVYVNPQSGEISDRHASGKRAQDTRGERTGNTAECNQRRCRDDLATPAAPALPTVKPGR